MVWAVRQSTLVQAFPIPNETASFVSNTLSGSTLIAVVNANDTSANMTGASVSDPANGNWTELGTAQSQTLESLHIFYKENAAVVTSAQSVTLSFSANPAGQGADLCIIEVTGLATSASIDPSSYGSTTGNATGAANASSVTDSLTTSVANDLYIVGVGEASGLALTWVTPTNWTLIKQSGSVAGSGTATAVYNLTSTSQASGTLSVTATTSTANITLGAKMGAWQVPAAGGATPVVPPMRTLRGAGV